MDDHQQHEVALGLRDGRVEAWNALYDAYAAPLWKAVARLMGPGAAEVDDVVQESFLAAARSARGFDPARGSLWLWLIGIARNRVVIHYRSQQRQDRVKQAGERLAEGNPQVLRWLEDREAEPPDAACLAELATLVRAALATLPDEYGILLSMKYLEDESVERIAESRRSTAEAVRSKLARARRALREAITRTCSCLRPAQDRSV